MEQYDDLAAGPDDNGSINLSHNTWREMPPELSEFRGLLHIDMTNNQLSTIPESIGNLILLRTLNVSLNQIETISSGIGRCIRLRKLNVAKNRIAALPPEVGNCILLVSICCDAALCRWSLSLGKLTHNDCDNEYTRKK